MASNFMYIDTNFPTFTGKESAREMSETILNYMRMLTEQLRYTLKNLDAGNFNTGGLETIKSETTAGVEERVAAAENSLNDLNSSVNSLTARVRNLGNNLENLQEEMETATEALEILTAAVLADEDGNVSIGGEGKNVTLTGNVTINGTPA